MVDSAIEQVFGVFIMYGSYSTQKSWCNILKQWDIFTKSCLVVAFMTLIAALSDVGFLVLFSLNANAWS